MTAKPTDADIPLLPETSDEVYQYLARSLRRKRGFGLFFVQCTPAQATDIIAKLKDDLAQKTMQELRLDRDSTTLYDQVETLWQQQPFDILFVTNLEASVVAYEDTKRLSGWGDPELIYTVSWKGVPPILSHLNQQRECFRDHFGCCFVFLVPPFVIKYFIQRAPDFFDWRSGLFIVPPNRDDLQQEAATLLSDEWNDYAALTPEARIEKLLTLRDHIDHMERHQSLAEAPETTADLLCQQGFLFASGQQYEDAIASYDKAIAVQPNKHEAWYNRGDALGNLGRYEDAITSYDHAMAIKPDKHEAWNNRGNALFNLGRYEDAIASYDKAIKFNPDDYIVWCSRGDALAELGRKEEAISNYDKALEIKPDYSQAWNNGGYTFFELGQYAKAISNFKEALQIKQDDVFLSNLAAAFGRLGQNEEVITYCDKALAFNPDNGNAWFDRGISLAKLDRYEEAIASYDRAIVLNSDDHAAWNNRGNALFSLGRYEDAITSYDRAVAIKPDNHAAWYYRGAALIKLRRYKEGLKSTERAVALNPDYGKFQFIWGNLFQSLLNSLSKTWLKCQTLFGGAHD